MSITAGVIQVTIAVRIKCDAADEISRMQHELEIFSLTVFIFSQLKLQPNLPPFELLNQQPRKITPLLQVLHLNIHLAPLYLALNYFTILHS